jgi:uncharacterized protein (DUF433 family)
MIWRLEKYLNNAEDVIRCVPIDTRVEQTCERIGIRVDSIAVRNRGAAHRALATLIVDVCKRETVPPLLFNVGAWMLGMARGRISRVPVELILRKIRTGMTPEQIRADHPKLTLDDIRAAETADYLAQMHAEDLLYRGLGPP